MSREDRSDVAGNLAVAYGKRTGATKVPYPILLREVEVVRTVAVGPSLVRLTLGGPGLAGFHSHCEEEHVRLVFPGTDGVLRLPEPDGDMLNWPRPRPVSREYTVRRHDPEQGELDIDLVLHDGGLAADWVRTVAKGERIHVAGPPGGLAIPRGYDRYLLAGDLTALPAIARILERLPDDARGWAFVEVADATEELPLTAPEGIEIRWVHRGGEQAGYSAVLERAVTAVRPPADARVFAWVAGEATSIKPVRRWLRDELGLGPEDRDVTGYWKRGVADFDDHGDDDHEHDHGEHDHEGHGHGHGH
ncbi:NADPH-dependent ferric siderophore reductase, contains FAD-binding and SIP domains [Pseudonocardia ammonioxydans]|uniref:NADPH-dependent ferric siderophore reductase, contains FAD-binding and SIP domains n=1 Tax=Pseudonocardia ammonioxydans TaxID=260086 RepID=A0A1I4S9C3_PSUAM|nr:NADPH-dependent ferric siderophore reductase, contains FAD-binding and SIP domains [Pseudonocardia ammonioxydans]